MANFANIREKSFDGVIIAGGGVAGCAAALGAARAGANVLVLESTISLGGMSTNGQIPIWMSGSNSPVQRELDKLCQQYFPTCGKEGIDHEALKIVLENLLAEHGVKVQYTTTVVEAMVENNILSGCYESASDGLTLWHAPLFIDATGDGALAAAAGVEFRIGREEDHLCQGASIAFEVENVHVSEDTPLPNSFNVPFKTPDGDAAELARKHLSPPAGHLILHWTPVHGVISANMTNATGFDFTDPAQRTEAIRLCRKQIVEIVAFLRRYMPGFEECHLRRSGNLFGVRESRHFKGRYTLTGEDILAGRNFPDWIARENHFPFDIHNVKGAGLDKHGKLEQFPDTKYQVPLAACLPEKIRHLMLAGRNISGTHLAHSSYRVMPICMNIGFGVGTAAAIALKNKVSPDEISPEELHNSILKNMR